MLTDKQLEDLVYRAVKIVKKGTDTDSMETAPLVAAVFTALVDEARLQYEADPGESQG